MLMGSVGVDGTNRVTDVLRIQRLLNRISAAEGGPEKKLVVDGIAGPLTQAAIKRFENHHLRDAGAVDARFEPGDPALARLLEMTGRAVAFTAASRSARGRGRGVPRTETASGEAFALLAKLQLDLEQGSRLEIGRVIPA